MDIRFLRLTTLMLSVMASPALTQQIPVQTGEHAAFTRLAMKFDTPVTWTEERTEAGYAVVFDDSNLSLDLSNSFRLIPRDRVTDLRWNADSGRLDIESSCDCHLDAYELPGNVLVLDVKNGPDPDEPVPDATAGGGSPSQPELPTAAASPALPLLMSDQTTITAGFEATPPPPELNGLSEEALLRSISAAASDGLISLTTPDPDNGATPGDIAGLLNHINSRSATAARFAPSDEADDQMRLNCPEPGDVDIASWGNGSPQQIIARGRNLLFDGRGNLDTDRVLEHAKSLLFIGFGAEARMYLKLLGTRSRQIDTLREISFVLDGQLDRPFPVLHTFMGCPPEAALWATASGGRKGGAIELDAEGLYGTFLALPLHLQKLLSASLIRTLRNIGEDEVAASLLAAMDRLPGTPSAQLRVLKGMDEIAEGDFDTGEIALGEVIFEGSDASPEALLHLMRAREERGTTVPEDILMLAESLAIELGDSPLATELLRASAIAHATDGRFETAFTLFEELGAVGVPEITELKGLLGQKLAQKAPDNVFLIMAFKHGLTDPENNVSPSATISLADRLLSLGFVEEARRLAASLPNSSNDATRLNAAIAIARGNPEDAVHLLSDATDPALRSMHATALRAVNAQPEAAELFDALGAETAARATAWESGTDDLISEFGTPRERNLIATINGGDDALPLGERAIIARTDINFGTLEDLLSGTAGFREAAQDLLEEQQVGNQ